MIGDAAAGREIGDYRLIEKIGQGGMAMVYRAVQTSTHRLVAVKIIDDAHSSGTDREFELRFAQEAHLIASLENLHIVPIYDYGIAPDGKAYIVMRLMSGSLADAMRDKPLSLDRAYAVFIQVAEGLRFAHSKGVIHRDIKPNNILLDEAGNAYLTDFGLARMLDASLSVTKTGVIVGAPAYASPEQLNDQLTDARSDVYSLGVLLYYMLTGRSPFYGAGRSFARLVEMQLHGDVPPVESLNPHVPESVAAVIRRAMAKDPADRFASVGAMLNTLRVLILPDKESVSHHASSSECASRRPATGDFCTWLTCGIVVIVLIIALGVVLLRSAALPSIAPGHADTGSHIDGAAFVRNQPDYSAGNASVIAYLSCSLDVQERALRVQQTREALLEYGYSMRLYDANESASEQPQQVETAILDGAAGLIVCPVDGADLRPALEAAAARSIPYVLLSPVESDTQGVVIAQQDEMMGYDAGIMAAVYWSQLPEPRGKIAVISVRGVEFSARQTGIMAALTTLQQNLPQIDEFMMPDGTSAFRDPAVLESALTLIQRGETRVIVTTSDAIAFALIAELDGVDIPTDAVRIFSIGGEIPSAQWIDEGRYLAASILPDHERASDAAVHALVRMLAGESVPQFIDLLWENSVYEDQALVR